VLTDTGKYLYEQLVPIVKELDTLQDKVKIKSQVDNKIIHMNVLAASVLATDAIIAYKQERKNINFQIFQNSPEALYDVEITTKDSNQELQCDREDMFVCNEQIYLAVPNTPKYAGMTSIKLKDVTNEGFISLYGSKQFRVITNKFCNCVGFSPKVIFESDSPDTVRNMIAANMGIGFWPKFTWGNMNNDQVKLLEIEDVDCSRDIVVTRNLNKSNNENVIDFFEYLKEYFEERRNA
jgi:DNA-binding transcriptional LysR family regulator